MRRDCKGDDQASPLLLYGILLQLFSLLLGELCQALHPAESVF